MSRVRLVYFSYIAAGALVACSGGIGSTVPSGSGADKTPSFVNQPSCTDPDPSVCAGNRTPNPAPTPDIPSETQCNANGGVFTSLVGKGVTAPADREIPVQ